MASSFTQAQLDALEAAIAQGALRVRFGDRELIYHSLKEMLEARALMRRALGIEQSGSSRVYFKHSKGTDSCG